MKHLKKQQTKFHAFVSELMANENKELQMYQSVIGMIYSLIEENRLPEIDAVLKETFPEFYVNE